MTRSLLLASMFVTLAAAPALGQTRSQARPSPPAAPSGLISVNVGWQSPSRTFSDSFSFDQYAEQGTADIEYKIDAGLVYEGGFGARLWKALGAGFSFSRFNQSSTAHVTGSIPHPFHFNKARTIEGDASGITRGETTINVQALAFFPAGSRVLLVLSAGPSFLIVKQDLVTAVKWDESYPFDTATFRTVDTITSSEHATGFNAGADVVFRFGRSFGLGALIRFTRAKVDLVPATGRTLSVDAGGFQAGAGLRILY